MKTRDKILISIWLFSVGTLAGVVFGRMGYVSKHDLLYPLNDPIHKTEVYLNVCDPPFNAIPNDTLSDADAFVLAVDVLGSIRIKPELFDSTMIYLKIPQGHYIIDKSIDINGSNLEYETPSILGVYGNGISFSNMNFNLR